MLTNLFTKSLRDAAVWTMGAVGVLVALAVVALPVYAELGDQYINLFEDMPDWIAVIYGEGGASVAGLVGAAMFSLMGPLVILIYAIALGTDAAVGEEEAVTLPLLLANPLGRRHVLVTKTTVVVIGIVAIALILWLTIETVSAIVGIDLEGQDVFAASVHLAALALLFGGVALAVSAWTGSSVRGVAVAAIAAVVSYVASTWLPIANDLAGLAEWSPWHLYVGARALQEGLDGLLLAVALGISAACFGIALVGLQRRDLKG